MGVSCLCRRGFCYDFENVFESVESTRLQEETISDLNDDDSRLVARKDQNMRFPDVCRCHRVLPISTDLIGRIPHSDIFDPSSPKNEAAIKLQKVYKSFRTRRRLADCAVLIEQSWWKLLDFAELKHSSISFFGLHKNETAISRWSRARTRAAKVGKGLSKNGKAQKLALQHWLEAIDPRHRYGHNLHFYYVKWLNSQSKEPFFYWLDIGEGKEVNLLDECPRPMLQQQCIKYLGPMERKAYEIELKGAKLFYKQTGELLDTTSESKGSKWIFVLSTMRTLYVGKKQKGSFQHSSFLAGGATLSAGRIVTENGVLKAVWPHSGHYRPTPENFQTLISFLVDNNVDLTDVKLDSTDEEDEHKSIGKKRATYSRSNSFEEGSAANDLAKTEENDTRSNSDEMNICKEAAAALSSSFIQMHNISGKLTTLEIPSDDNLVANVTSGNKLAGSGRHDISEVSFDPEPDCTALTNRVAKEKNVTEESISRRINSHEEINPNQSGIQLPYKWSTGAGARISCLRDYPQGLQCHALQQVNLSPRSKRCAHYMEQTGVGSCLSRSSSCHATLLQSLPVK